MINVFKYNTSVYKFREWAESVIGWTQLEQLHEKRLENAKTNLARVYSFTKLMNDTFHSDAEIRKLFAQFVEREIQPLVDFEPWLEIYPNFRVHEANQRTTSHFHRDRDYLIERGSLKVWLPFTRVSKGGALWVESQEEKEDFQPYEMEYGEALLFDSLNLQHGCHFNDSGSSRVSIDFIIRLNPYKRYTGK